MNKFSNFTSQLIGFVKMYFFTNKNDVVIFKKVLQAVD